MYLLFYIKEKRNDNIINNVLRRNTQLLANKEMSRKKQSRHSRLAYLTITTVNKSLKYGRNIQISDENDKIEENCTICCQGKLKRNPFSKKSNKITSHLMTEDILQHSLMIIFDIVKCVENLPGKIFLVYEVSTQASINQISKKNIWINMEYIINSPFQRRHIRMNWKRESIKHCSTQPDDNDQIGFA